MNLSKLNSKLITCVYILLMFNACVDAVMDDSFNQDETDQTYPHSSTDPIGVGTPSQGPSQNTGSVISSGNDEINPNDEVTPSDEINPNDEVTPDDEEERVGSGRDGLDFEERPLEEVRRTTERGPQINWTGSFDRYGRISIIAVHGRINVRPSQDDSTVTIRASLHSDEGDVNDLSVEIVEHTWGITVCALYLNAGVDYNVCAIDGSSNVSFTDSQGREVFVDFDISIPSKMHTEAGLTFGDISVQNVKRSVNVVTALGSIDVVSDDIVNAASSNGDVNVVLNPINYRHYHGVTELAFAAPLGDITISVPNTTNAHFTGVTVFGEVNTDFNLAGEGGQLISGEINQGGSLTLSSISTHGNIELNAH